MYYGKQDSPPRLPFPVDAEAVTAFIPRTK
jgi:hypothetical protein